MCELPAGDMFECWVLMRAFAGSHVCACGIGWRLIVLGAEQLRAGARAFLRGGGGAMLGGRVCDVVVTPCDVRRLEMVLARIVSFLLLCLG